MLDSLPPEIIEHIVAHLQTASSITHVAQVNRKLYSIVSADDYAIFRRFLQRAFPSVKTTPPWKDAACRITSRSRAWDRNSFIARECYYQEDDVVHPRRAGPNQRFGYVPAIDSYETGSSVGHKQVLAVGAAGRLRIRTTELGRTYWVSYRPNDDFLAHNDIFDVRLLRPHQHQNKHGEVVIYRRANGTICQAESNGDTGNFAPTTRYFTEGNYIDCLDVNSDTDPLMVICNTRTIQLFPVHSNSERVRPSSVLNLAQNFEFKHRKRCVKFLDSHRIATSIQYVEGRETSPILIYDVHPTGALVSAFDPSLAIHPDVGIKGRQCANIIAPLDNTALLASRPNQVFLSGWTDGTAKLHDLRTPSQVISQYIDPVDDGQILSLSVVGHEKFFAGSHQNACLKIFDLRMPGARVYSYLDSLAPPTPKSQSRSQPPKPPPSTPHTGAGTKPTKPLSKPRDINIFLAVTVARNGLWLPLPRTRNQTSTNQQRYRGSIYSLSTPSPTSPTLYAGIQNHVIQLDFVNTDDILRDRSSKLSVLKNKPAMHDVFSLSCYERPRRGREMTDPVLLRKQIDWSDVVAGGSGGGSGSNGGNAEEGWDCRWRLARSEKSERKNGW